MFLILYRLESSDSCMQIGITLHDFFAYYKDWLWNDNYFFMTVGCGLNIEDGYGEGIRVDVEVSQCFVMFFFFFFQLPLLFLFCIHTR